MARPRKDLELRPEVREQLERISRSRTEGAERVRRSQVLLAYVDGVPIAEIERDCRVSRPAIYNTVSKAREVGPLAAIDDLRGSRGRPERITSEARAWVVSLACQKPVQLGYPHELWTRDLLARHIRQHCDAVGHPSLANIAPGTVTKILLKNRLKPHKIKYYVEKRDPEFDTKMVQVLHVYRKVQLVCESADASMTAFLSYDEKPGIQALGRTGPDLPPKPGRHPENTRDYEYVRHGTLTLMAGLDLVTGEILAHIVPRHRSREFIEFLRKADEHYPTDWTIVMVLDNHSAHTSKETRSYLATVAGRFEFVFTPKHGSWLNLVENLFAKLAKSVLRGLRVDSREQLKQRLALAIDWLNEDPTVFRWSYRLDEMGVS